MKKHTVDIKIPNKITEKTFKNTDEGNNLKIFTTAKDFYKDLGI